MSKNATIDHKDRPLDPGHSPTAFTLPWRMSILAVAGLILLALAQVRPAIADSQAPLLNSEGLLWRIDTPGSAPSYLFGTIHLTDDRVTRLPSPVLKALDSASSLTGETILAPETYDAAAPYIRLTGARDLEDILGNALYAKVLNHARGLGMSDGSLRRLKPSTILSLIFVPPDELARMANGHLTIDETLQVMARSRGIPVHGLENIAEQTEAYDGLPEADLIEFIRELLDRQPQLRALTEELISHYLSGDLAAFHARSVEIVAGYDRDRVARYTNWVVDRRNLRMVNRMASVLSDGKALLAVGALHLPGENGLLNLLEQRGHGITRVY